MNRPMRSGLPSATRKRPASRQSYAAAIARMVKRSSFLSWRFVIRWGMASSSTVHKGSTGTPSAKSGRLPIAARRCATRSTTSLRLLPREQTRPMPEITQVLSGAISVLRIALNNHAGMNARETAACFQDAIDPVPARGIGDHIQPTPLVLVFQVDRRRQDVIPDRQHRTDHLDGIRGGQAVADLRLDRGDRDRGGAFAEDRIEGVGFSGVVLRGGRAVRIDEVDPVGSDAGIAQCPFGRKGD